MKTTWIAGAIGAVMAMLCASAALAQTAWPARPIRIIVPYAPAGSTDNGTRPYTEKLSTALGQQVVVENRGGAAGVVGTEAVMRSAPDGYTFGVIPVATLTVLPAARKMPFDPFKDFVPVSKLFENTLVFAIHPSLPANNMAEFVAYARQNPGKLSFGSSGLGSMTQMTCESVKFSAKIDMLHVPYRGGGEAVTDFLAGHVQVFCEGNILPHVKAGKARLLGVADNVRHPDFPDVPMLKEIWPEADSISWAGVFAPAGTPDAIVRRMSEEIRRAAADPALAQQMLPLALRPVGSTPEELAAELRKDYERYGKLVKALDFRME